ncbi:YdeI/OmpD-associated family protein [Hyphobacterium sp. CCMP332]|nr:YdeI/OmpD-associated family protein [Hyphobacterium sp. CCMP332]
MTDQFNSRVENFNTNLWGHHFIVPEEIAKKYIEGDNRRVICTLNGIKKVRAALMPSKNGWYILLNKKVRSELEIEEESKISVLIEKDRSEFGMDVPEEFIEVMGQEELAWERFQQLTPGKQRTLIYIVNKVKNTDSRIRKALAIAHHLKEMKDVPDFKRINELIKYYNNLR